MKSAVIVGATSPIGRAVAVELAKSGCSLVLASRDEAELHKISQDIAIRYDVPVQSQTLDLEQSKTLDAFVSHCIANQDLDCLISCAGYMPPQEDAQKNPELFESMVRTNYSGIANLLERFAPYFEQRKSGCIATVSSVAGDRGRLSNYLYGSTKAALDTYVSGLRCRLARSNVHLLNVKPGFVDTQMTWGVVQSPLMASPETIAQDLVKGLQAQKDEIYSPFFWRYIMGIIRRIPSRIFKRLTI